jgi:hypothetical protein
LPSSWAKAEREAVEFLLLHVDPEHRAIERGGAVQIGDRNVEPHGTVVQ